METSKPLNDETKVPLRWVALSICACFALMGVIGGLIFWGGRLEARADNAEKSIVKIQDEQADFRKDFTTIKTDIATIKAIVEGKKRGD